MQQKIINFVASRRFFYGVVALLVLQALWIALSGRYPMAFDEDFHLGIIRLYAHHLAPFWTHQPADANYYGAVYRDPSYLYHWLMSFPYRLISTLTHSLPAQVIALRFINIALFASGLPLFRRLLLQTRAPAHVVHLVLAILVLLPVVPLLAAQINYDNLFIPLVTLILLLVLEFDSVLKRYKRPHMQKLIWIILLCLLASLVKYAFLPIFFVVGVWIAMALLSTYGWRRKLLSSLGFGITLIPKARRWLLLSLLIIALGLFTERYGLNLIRYHTPVPDCDKVLSIQECSSYAPWARDYTLAVVKGHVSPNPVVYTQHWFYGMWFRLFFAVDGPGTLFETRGPLLLPSLAAIVFAGGGVLALMASGKRIWQVLDRRVLEFTLSISLVYIIVLWADEFRGYLHTGQPVAINGRYLLPVIAPLLLVWALAYREALRFVPRLRLVLAGVLIACLIWGGGALTYILRSRPAWYWDNSTVRAANADVQTIAPAIPGANSPVLFLH